MKHLVHRAVVQGLNVGSHLFDEDANVEFLFSGPGVKRIKDLLEIIVDIPGCIKHAAHHKGVGHCPLVDRGVPGLTERWGVTLLHLGQHQVAKVLGGGVNHPDTRLICCQV